MLSFYFLLSLYLSQHDTLSGESMARDFILAEVTDTLTDKTGRGNWLRLLHLNQLIYYMCLVKQNIAEHMQLLFRVS